jgi:lipoate-protein ligase A
MRYVNNQNITDPRSNLALEEFLLRHVGLEEPILLFYVNEPSVIIGRNQNTLEEIDPDYVKANGVHVVRRLSGGGAVYHDLGNLNFSFITTGAENLHNFQLFTEPVIRVLNQLNVPAELHGRSDIFVAGKKISGNAQYLTRNRMFSHGTILFDSDLEALLHALNPRQIKIESKAVQSIRSVVGNVRDWLPGMSIGELKQALLDGIFGADGVRSYELSAEEWAQVAQIRAERYETWEWNIGRSPRFTIQKSERFPVGKIDARVDVERGRIKNIKFFGDFAGLKEVQGLEAHLIGVRYDRDELAAALNGRDIAGYFGELPAATLLDLLY